MPRKYWTFGIHPEYSNSLRRIVSDADRYNLGIALREALERADDPTKNAEPVENRAGRYTIELLGYIVTFEVVEAESKIRLLPIRKPKRG